MKGSVTGRKLRKNFYRIYTGQLIFSQSFLDQRDDLVYSARGLLISYPVRRILFIFMVKC